MPPNNASNVISRRRIRIMSILPTFRDRVGSGNTFAPKWNFDDVTFDRTAASFDHPDHVPTVTLEGDANGAPHPDPSSYAKKFSGKYSHRTITGGVGHNLPQEAPQAFAKAIIDVAEV